MRALETAVRKQLSDAVLAARRASESASRAAIAGLGVFDDRRPEHLSEQQATLRNGLRAKWRQLGRKNELLIAECAYEQWHRLLFARFLAENKLLLHPDYGVSVSIDDCDDGAIVPSRSEDIGPLWAYARSGELERTVRSFHAKLSVETGTLLAVPFDIDHWRKVAEEQYPDGLPEPYSNDPTQWLFEGRPEDSTDPLQVAVGRLLGYRWPEQPDSDELDPLADADGIVCLPSVKGEPPAADRLDALLATAFGESWSSAKARQLIEETGSNKKNLADWLRDDFFKQHCALFGKRPFIWHIWDGQRDGFSALVDYHRLDYKNLERLTYTYLGDWLERQRAAAQGEAAGAEKRLAAALALRERLEAILEGEPPYDIYVRWKELREQPIGWNPDLNDGVRLNIRPFVEAGVLRSKFSIHWRKDRGKNPDGSERHNDLHLSIAEKQAAREGVGV